MLNFCFHRWNKWGKAYEYGFELYQNRECLKCGKIQQREIGWSANDFSETENKENNFKISETE